MIPESERWVPKVHPATRPAAAEDPLELHANAVPGDPDYMLECLVQEFAWLGWQLDDLLRLFHDPGYPVLQQLLAWHGEAVIRERVAELLRPFAGLRLRATIVDEPDPEAENEPELLQLNIRRDAAAQRRS